MWQRHKKIIIAVVVSFLLVRYGIIERGDVKAIVTDIRAIVKVTKTGAHEFKEFLEYVFN